MIPLLILGGLILLFLMWLWATYNGLVTSKVRVEEAWSDITVQLKRRYDLIPQLVNTVKGYAKHEKELFENVTKARTAAMTSLEGGHPEDVAQKENQFAATLKTLFAVSEAYPDLKANENFLQLQGELVDTENKIQAARRFYNAAVRDFNIKILQFPVNMLAKRFGFVKQEFFEVENQGEVEQPVDVNFDQ